MFSKIWASCVLVSALCVQVTAHAVVSPALGVPGVPSRADVTNPTDTNPCGRQFADFASAIDSATAVPADATGSFLVNASNFNGGRDGSLKFTGKVDASGTAKKFVQMDITTNGDNNPAGVETQPITASLPAGTKCTGGKAGNLCVAQFISGANFGNCVVVSQGTAGAGTPTTTKNSGKSAASPAASHCPGHGKNTTSNADVTGAAHAGSLLARSWLAGVGNPVPGAAEIEIV